MILTIDPKFQQDIQQSTWSTYFFAKGTTFASSTLRRSKFTPHNLGSRGGTGGQLAVSHIWQVGFFVYQLNFCETVENSLLGSNKLKKHYIWLMFNFIYFIYISATLSNQLAYIRFIHVHSKATNGTTTAGRPRSYIFNPAMNQQPKTRTVTRRMLKNI